MPGSYLQRVYDAIVTAQYPGPSGPYGLYDYSGYGRPQPHVIRDFRDPQHVSFGTEVFASADKQEAEREHGRLTAEHVARAAIAAMREPTNAMINAAGREVWGPDWSKGDPADTADFTSAWRAAISEALK